MRFVLTGSAEEKNLGGYIKLGGEKIHSVHWDRHWLELFQAHLDSHRYAERTVKLYRQCLLTFFEWGESRGIAGLSDVTRSRVEEYQRHLFNLERKGKHLKAETQGGYLTAVKAFFRFLCQQNILLSDPAADVAPPKRKRGLPQGIMTAKEVANVLRQPDVATPLGLRDRAMLELLYSSGLRSEELRNLVALDLDFAALTVWVKHGKGGKSRWVPMGEVAAFYLQRYLEESRPKLVSQTGVDLLFVSRYGNPMPATHLVSLVKRYAKQAGLKKNITPHSFRHTCATHMLKGKADLRHIQQMLGHASVESTEIYTHVEISDLKKVHHRCHPREKRWNPDAGKPLV